MSISATAIACASDTQMGSAGTLGPVYAYDEHACAAAPTTAATCGAPVKAAQSLAALFGGGRAGAAHALQV